jgi:hypothetical protein
MTPRELANAHFLCLLDRADEKAARETERRRQLAQFPKQSMCHGCASDVGWRFSEIMSLVVTEQKHGLRVYDRATDACPHQCILCGDCEHCYDLTNSYDDYVEANKDNADYWAFGLEDLGEYGCPKVEPVRSRKVKSKPTTVVTLTTNKVKTMHTVKPKSSRRPRIRTHT